MDDEVVSTGGVLVHDQSDWPCAMCRPRLPAQGGNLLCVDCAHKIVMSSFARFEGQLPRPGSVEDTLAFLETTAAVETGDTEPKATAAWDLLSPEAFDLEDR